MQIKVEISSKQPDLYLWMVVSTSSPTYPIDISASRQAGQPLWVSVVQSLMATGISTSLAMLLMRSVLPQPVGPSNMTLDFSRRDGGFRCV